jgi:hypothetical protein
MDIYEEDINQKSGVLVFAILLSLFLLVFSGNSGSKTPVLSGNDIENGLAFVNVPKHSDAIVINDISLPDLFKSCISATDNPNLNLFSIQYIISCYNHRTVLNFINTQKKRLVIEPLLLRRIFYTFSSCNKESLPSLS